MRRNPQKLTTVTIATAATPATRATTRWPLFTRARFIYRESPTLEFLLMKHRNGFGRVFGRGHLDKGETARASGRPILHDVHRHDTACLSEVILEIVLCCGEWKVTNE